MKLTRNKNCKENKKEIRKFNKLKMTFGILFVVTFLSVISLLGMKQGYFTTPNSLAETSVSDWSSWGSDGAPGIIYATDFQLRYQDGSEVTGVVNLECIYTWPSIKGQRRDDYMLYQLGLNPNKAWGWRLLTLNSDDWDDGEINSDDQTIIANKSNTIVSSDQLGLYCHYVTSEDLGIVYGKVSKELLTQSELVPVHGDNGGNGWKELAVTTNGSGYQGNSTTTIDELIAEQSISAGDRFYIYLYADGNDINHMDSVVRVYPIQTQKTTDANTDITLTTRSGITFTESNDVSVGEPTTNAPIYITDLLKFSFSDTAAEDLPSNMEIRYTVKDTFDSGITSDQLDRKAVVDSLTEYGVSTGTFYIYVQLVGVSSNHKYKDSNIAVYKVEQKSVADITLSASVNGSTTATTADAGDVVTLTSSYGSGTDATAIFYRDDGKAITLATAADTSGLTMDGTNYGTEDNPIYFVEGSSYDYIYYRNAWYQVDTEVQYYDATAGISIPNSIRTKEEYTVYAFGVPKISNNSVWPEMSIPAKVVTYKVEIGESVGNVEISATDATGAPLVANSNGNIILGVGDKIKIAFSETTEDTSDWEIFYTFTQSTPVVSLESIESGYETKPGNTSTKKYDLTGDGIEITEDDITLGSSLYITAMGVSYDKTTGAKLLNNGSTATANYYFDDMEMIKDSIIASPETSDTQTTEIKEGDFIRLSIVPYAEEADNESTTSPTMFYTIDGTEPVVIENDGVYSSGSSSTFVYNTSAIQVPKASNALFTITAVLYQSGYRSSEIYRFTYQYPDVVSVPYAVPTSGTVVENTTVTLNCATEDVIIYYEIAYGGKEPIEPTNSSNVFLADNPIIINDQTWIKAYAVGENGVSSIVSFKYTLAGKLSVPTPSISSGAVVSSGTLITLTAGDTGTIYYTTDGSDPSDPKNTSALVGSTVILSGDPGTAINIKTCSKGTNYSSSDIGFYSYTISSFEGGVFTDIETDSTVANNSQVRLYTDVTNGTIYYTTDGTMPSSSSASGGSVTVSGASGGVFNIKAMALSQGATQTNSAATFTYNLMAKLKGVVADVPTGAIFTEVGSVALSAEVGTIYYTTDGTEPTITSTLYTEPIEIKESTVIKAFTVEDEFEDSDIKEFSYTFAEQVARPNASQATGEIAVNEEVNFSTTTTGATIYYTTNGTEPSLSDKDSLQLYTGPITVTKATTYCVMAVKEGMENSDVLTCRYTVREPVVEEVESVTETAVEETTTSGRLQSRSTFADTSGPSFTDILLKNITYGIVLSGDYGSINEGAQLKVEKMYTSDASTNMVQQRLGEDYRFVANYDVTLSLAGEQIQPEGQIEIGLPIPSEYENAMIYIVHTADDGTMEIHDTRRSNGVAYAMVSHLSSYGIVAPVLVEEVINYTWLIIVSVIGTLGLLIIGAILIKRARKNQNEERG